MIQLDLDDFLAQFKDTLQHKLRDYAAKPEVLALVAWDNAGTLSASAFTSLPDSWPETAVSVYCKQPLQLEPEDEEDDMALSKTMRALALVEDQGLTPYAAAVKVGISKTAVYRALARREGKKTCPCCGQVVRDGFKVDRSVLKA